MPVCRFIVSTLLLAAAGLAQTPAAQPAAQPASGPRGPRPEPAPGKMPFVHDPSTVIRSGGLYYVFTTGRGIPILSSPDLVNWTRQGSVFTAIPDDVHAVVPKNNGTDVWAPDILRIGKVYYLYYAVSSWGSFNSAVALATNTTLNPKDPDYKWVDRGVVVSSDGTENLNAIDPGVMLAPDGTLWLCYGSYHGTIDLIQLDPKTGLRISPNSPVSIIATGSEASDIIFHGGYYYLFVNHGSCCKGKDSSYNIRVGRAKTPAGPYLDRYGQPLTVAPGNLFLAAHDHRIGPGHFGRVIEDSDTAATQAPAERFSLHYEADLENQGRSDLDIRPLLWSTDGWPIAGDNLAEGIYQIVAHRSEDALEFRVPTAAKPAANASAPAQTAPTVPAREAAAYSEPPSRSTVRLARWVTTFNQRWGVAPAGDGLYKILNLANGLALEIQTGSSLDLAPFTAVDAQLWYLDQLPGGAYRIRNKATGLVLAAPGIAPDTNAVVATPLSSDDLHTWLIGTP
jgi:arabinan endo-1,5-alpha-L-arabinosidase